MSFPKINKQAPWLTGILLGTVITIIAIAVSALTQSNNSLIIPPTATKTETPIPTDTATPTNSPTNTATPTNSPTNTATPTNSPTNTATPTNTSTPIPPTPTIVPPIFTNTPTAPEFVAVITATLELSQTFTITQISTPAPTSTPVPRTVYLPTDLPDYSQAEEHFWFTRPFTDTFNGWGGYYYPYGTNAKGRYLWHFGIDILNSHGTTIVAVGDGTVIYAGEDDEEHILGPGKPNFYGKAVVIEHDQLWKNRPVYTLYGHVSRVLVSTGQQVKAGDLIAEVGQLGVATGPHLHLEVRVGNNSYFDTRNPDLWVRPDSGFGVVAGRVVDYQDYYVPQQLVTLHRANLPSRFWRQTFTYPDDKFNSDEDYVETFTFSDVPTGEYILKTFFDGRQLTVPISVTNKATSFTILKQNLPPPTPRPPTSTPDPLDSLHPTDELSPPPEGEQ